MSEVPAPSAYQHNLHRFALFLACYTPLLLLAGALVTSTGSSLAVPDWPLSFGKFFPQMTGGVLFEHGHRMIAGTVVLFTVGLGTFLSIRMETRKWVKFTAVSLMFVSLAILIWVVSIFFIYPGIEKDNYSNVYFALRTVGIFLLPLTIGLMTSKQLVNRLTGWGILAVLLQAVLGGLTVLLHLPTQISVAHAGLAQIYFCLVVTLALVTSKSWIEEKPNRLTDRPSPIRKWAFWTTLLVYLQILVGAITRHSGAGLAIPDFPLSNGNLLPADWSFLVAIQFLHTRIGASFVLLFVAHTAYRACVHFPEEKGLFWPAAAAGLLVWIQCFLGIMILATGKAIVPTSVHVLVGAGLLASMVVFSLKSHQLFKKEGVS